MSAALDQLQMQVTRLTAEQPFAVHWQIQAVEPAAAEDSITIGQGEHTQLASFSTRKVSLLLACLALVRRGDLALEQRLIITESLKDGVQAGIMKNLDSGVELNLEDHLRQMMITSDNICTQLVFDAIGQVAGDPLQWVNDYCSWVGLHSTVHREIFPRSGDLAWHHSIEQMTVTSAADQARLLGLLGRATLDDGVAESLHLSSELCRFAVELMTQIHTPLLGASTSALRFAEKNGRGLRSLSQVGLALDAADQPVAAVAVFAEHIPAQLPDGKPGRLAAYDLFASIGQAVEQWHARRTNAGRTPQRVTPEQLPQPQFCSVTVSQGTTTPLQAHAPTASHSLQGVGKLFAALVIAERSAGDPALIDQPVIITDAHRQQAQVGPLKTHTGDITLRLGDAVGLVIGTSDASASLAVRAMLQQRQISIAAEAQHLVERLSQSSSRLTHTVVEGEEDSRNATGDFLTGRSSSQDLVHLLTMLAQAGGLTGGPAASSSSDTVPDRTSAISRPAAEQVLTWMAQVFEPAGLSYSLPGYGPRKVPQWSVAGSQQRRQATDRSSTSVLITRPDDTAGLSSALAVTAAHLPHDPAAEPVPRMLSAQTLGALGLAAHRACGKIEHN